MDSIEQLITDLKESLEREIGGLAREMREGFAPINKRFDDQAAQLDRDDTLWPAAISRLERKPE